MSILWTAGRPILRGNIVAKPRSGQKFTTPLPDKKARSAIHAEQITLVPYGNTHVRAAIVPNLKKVND